MTLRNSFVKKEKSRCNNFLLRYTEKGEIKDRFMCFNSDMSEISAYKKDGSKIDVLDKMNIKDFDQCVRSCTTQAFSNASGIFTRSKFKI